LLGSWPFVSIIIPNFNGANFIKKCLTSLFNTDYPDFEVIFVDDASTDESVELVKRLFEHDKRLKVIRNAKNAGAATAKNIGITSAKGEVLCFLDNDTEVDPNWLKELIKTLQSDPLIGAVQSKLLDIDCPQRIQVAGVLLIPYVGWAIARGQGKMNSGLYDSIDDICALSTALAVKREILNEIGSFDAKLAVFTEDLDFSWRLWLSGYRIVLAPRSIVYHWHKPLDMRRKMSVTEVIFNFHFTKNSLRTLIKNYEIKNLVNYLPWALFIILFRAVLILFRKKSLPVFIGSIKGILWNLLNLRNTMRERHKIQHFIRRVPDDYLMQRIMVNKPLIQIYRDHFKR
jgi:GT2 family glycosyltransferase